MAKAAGVSRATVQRMRTDMNNNPTPLACPTGWPRTRARDRERSRFRNARAVDDQLSMSDATSRLIRECRLLGAANVIVSTNVAVRRDGLPYARQRTPGDPLEDPPGSEVRRSLQVDSRQYEAVQNAFHNNERRHQWTTEPVSISTLHAVLT